MMHEFEILLGLLVAVAVLAVVAQKLKVPYPILLVLGGLALGFVPGLPKVELEPDVVFLLFLPPLLTSAAWNTSWRDFQANRRPIFLLAIGLVLVTTTAVAVVAHWAIPNMPWATAFALGAIVSPPDAVAATAITQRLGVPHQVVTILEGESLVNDATGLVAYRFAVAAGVTGLFSIWEAGLRFLVLSVGGVLLGLAMGWLVVWIHRQIEDSLVEITTTILMSYITYLVAEHLGVSGVLSVVALGLYHRRHSSEVLSPRTRIQAIATWDMLVFLLNGLIFILIGLQLPHIIEAIAEESLLSLSAYAGLISLTVILVRLLWVGLAAYLPQSNRAARAGGNTDWSQVIIIGWAGMRGIVSLAAALAIPLVTDAGTPFPQRNLVIFLTFCVILVTLVLQGLTLPPLIRWLKVTADNSSEREEMQARLRSAEAAMAHIESVTTANPTPIQTEMVDWLRTQYRERIRRLSVCCDALNDCNQQKLAAFQRLQNEAVEAERRTVIRLRNQGAINDEVLQKIERDLDLEATRLGGSS
ncbi:MAG: Na+/H+ antiporter [Elainella sp.]